MKSEKDEKNKKNEFLCQARLNKGWTQEELAEKLEASKNAVKAWENGRRSPAVTMRGRLCNIFGLTAAELGLEPTDIPKEDHQEVPQTSVPTALSPKPGDQNRLRMIKRVRTRWINGVLDRSLSQGSLIHLHWQERPDAILNPWAEVVQESNVPLRLMPEETRLIDVYDNADGALLILGEPGAGKTTSLLELTCDLLSRAKRDETHPLPVVFNLSSWTQRRLSLPAWMIEELNSKYHVPHKLAEKWVEASHILPLLDGLDEMVETERTKCVQAINAYRKEHGFVPMVICGRISEYLALDNRLAVNNAVTIEPLTLPQIEKYLSKMGKSLQAVQIALRNDACLQEMVSNPLMLNIIALTFQNTSLDAILSVEDPIQRRKLIFEKYIEVVLKRRGPINHYSPEQTISWLAWLAQQMQKHNQTEFYVERMQPDWLPDNQSRQLYRSTVIRLIYGSSYMLSTALFGWLRGGQTTHGDGVGEGLLGWLGSGPGNQVLGWMAPGLGGGISGGGTVGLVFGVASVLIGITVSTGTLKKDWSYTHLSKSLAKGALDGFKVVIIIGVFTGLLFGLTNGASIGFSHGLAYGLIGGLVAGLHNALIALQRPKENQKPKVSKQGKRLTILDGLIITLCAWCGFAIVNGFCVGATQGIRIGAIVGLFTGLLFLFSSSAASDLIPGLDTEIKPAETVTWSWRNVKENLAESARKGLTLGLSILVIVTVFIGLACQLFHGLLYGSIYGLVYGPILGLITGIASLLVEILKSGWSSDILDKRQFIQPNEGIHRCARNSLFAAALFGPIGGIASGLVCGLAFGLFGRLPSWSILGTGFTIVFGCLFAFDFWSAHGGNALIEHLVLRFRLWRAGSIPWNYVRFLDYATERILLRKVGGGYIFVHRLLLDHLASLNTEKPENPSCDPHS